MATKASKREGTRAGRRCPACGGAMVHESQPDTIAYKGESVEVSQPGWWCQECEEAVLEPADQEATERAFLELRARVDGILLPEEVTDIRERLGLSQRRAGELLGGGPRAFQKYEQGVVTVSRPMSNLLRVLAARPEALGLLAPQGGDEPEPEREMGLEVG